MSSFEKIKAQPGSSYHYRRSLIRFFVCTRTLGGPLNVQKLDAIDFIGYICVIACPHAYGSRPVLISCRLYCRLDESTSAACHRLPHRRESYPSGTDWGPSNAV